MASNIITPQALWGNFKITEKPEVEVISERKQGDVIVSRVYIGGRNTADGKVKIYGTMARNIQLAIMPAVLIVKDFATGAGDEISVELAKKGYFALSIDVAGERDGEELFTVYPEDVGYANYARSKDALTTIKKGVKDSCWYEWGVAVRYAFEYLYNQPCVNSVGAVGVKDGATLLWQLAGTDNRLSAMVSIMNAGWSAYKNQRKFGSAVDVQLSDDMFKYVAGVEPQSYAPNVKCPTLLLVATNSDVYDADRAQDTLARIDDKIYTAICYAPNEVNGVDVFAYRDLFLFLDEFLLKDSKSGENLPIAPEVKGAFKNGKFEIEVKADEMELAELCAFVSEGAERPSIRSWKKVGGTDVNEKGHRVFYYAPYPNSAIVTYYVKARYDNGFTICSPITAKRFKPTDVDIKYKERIVFSGRERDAVSIFAEMYKNDEFCLSAIEKNVGVKEKNGPMGIAGAYAKNGLITFKVNAEKDKPEDGSMLMLDVYAQSDDELTVKLVCDYFGNKTEYIWKEAVKGGKVWHNVKIDMNKFKTVDGRIIKSYAHVNAIEFSLNGTYIINNVLWL